jgi:hypothetical protein
LGGAAPPEVAELYARARLSDCGGAIYGAGDLEAGEAALLLARALPPAQQ